MCLREHGDRSSIGRALDCGSSGCGFKPHRSPFFIALFSAITVAVSKPFKLHKEGLVPDGRN
jgi:hypothetical protein